LQVAVSPCCTQAVPDVISAIHDYELFGRWSADGVYFVTRLKDNARYRVVKNLPLSHHTPVAMTEDPGIIS
jgi:predicted glycosyl hydrolase (DUF1957 family)